MLAQRFPDLKWLKRQADTSFADRRSMTGQTLHSDGWPNVIMHATEQEVVRDDIRGPLSIFTNWSGYSELSVDIKRVRLSPEVFFLTNVGQYYTLEIHEKTPTQTANIHFGEKFSREALRTIPLAPERLLEGDGSPGVQTFYNRVVPVGPAFRQIIASLLTPGNTSLQEDQGLYELLILISQDEASLQRMQQSIKALKASTKTEITRRLLQVTDYLYTHPEANPTLEELSRISCLSKFHFLRLFKIAYGQSPHKFITSIKMLKAQQLLRTETADVKAIAHRLGFENASSFSRLFNHFTGAYPTAFRAQA